MQRLEVGSTVGENACKAPVLIARIVISEVGIDATVSSFDVRTNLYFWE